MQESIHSYRENKSLRSFTESLVDLESTTLDERMQSDRLRAYAKHEGLKEIDPTAKMTIRETRNIGRNDICPCGSNKKFKKCCGSRLATNDDRLSD